MPESTKKPRAVGINHVALQVGSIDEALKFYGELTKAEQVLSGMGLPELTKTPDAIQELAEKGMAP